MTDLQYFSGNLLGMNKLYCSNCGQLVSGDAKFCTYCGAQQHGVEARFRAQDAPLEAGSSATTATQDIVPIKKSNLDPRVILVFFFSYFRKTSILVPALIVGCFFYLNLFLLLLAATLLAMLLVALFVYNNFQYEINEAGLTIDSGIIFKKKVTVPFEQVQNVNIERSLLDRIFGLARISIETAGSSNHLPQTVATTNGPVRSEGYLPGIDLQLAKVIHDTLIDGASDAI